MQERNKPRWLVCGIYNLLNSHVPYKYSNSILKILEVKGFNKPHSIFDLYCVIIHTTHCLKLNEENIHHNFRKYLAVKGSYKCMA